MHAVIRKVDGFLSARAPWTISACGLVLVGLLGILDYISGFEMSFSVFYLIPIGLTTWYASGRIGVLMCILSAFTWLFVDYITGHTYSRLWIPYWNAGVRFSFFIAVTMLTAALRSRLAHEHETARFDHLTRLKNPLAFNEDAGLLFRNARRHGYPLTVGFIDLDDFKRVNDTLGHAEGDRVLRAVADTAIALTRESDLIARLGGDEFVVVLSHTDLDGARTYFERLHARLHRSMDGGGWRVGFSIGVIIYEGDIPDPGEAVRHADALMYRVKQGGKDSVRYALHGDADGHAAREIGAEGHA